MSRARIKALAKLFLLLGLPVGLLSGLFAGGIYVGATHRATILSIEKDWLGMDVEVPATTSTEAEGAADAGWLGLQVAAAKTQGGEAKPGEGDPTTPPTTPETNPTTPPTTPETNPTTPPTTPETNPTTPPTVPPTVSPTVPPTVPPGTEPLPASLLDPPLRPAMPMTVTLPERLSPELQAAVRDISTVKVKVLVDSAWAEKAADPFSYVNQTVEWASSVYETQLGLRLQLQSIALWEGAPSGVPAKLSDLCERPREGAQLLLAFTGDAFNGEDSFADASCAVIPQSPRSRQAPHLRSLLFGVGRLLGASPIKDPGSDAWRRGSWMGDALADDALPLWIDAESREAMIRGKRAAPWDRPGAAPRTGTEAAEDVANGGAAEAAAPVEEN